MNQDRLTTYVHTHKGRAMSVVLLEDIATEARLETSVVEELARRSGVLIHSVDRRAIKRGVGFAPAVVTPMAWGLRTRALQHRPQGQRRRYH